MKTMGQAVDEALVAHTERFPESEVYNVEVFEAETKDGVWKVLVQASHFSTTLVYEVSQDGVLR